MKLYLFILLTFLIVSCSNSEIDIHEYKRLEQEYSKLKKENLVLKDSLLSYNENFIKSQMLVGISDDLVLKVGKKNNIQVIFHSFGIQLPRYEIYRIEGNKDIKIGSSNKTRFNYEFIPKSTEDNKVSLKVKMPFKDDIIEIPADMILPVEE